LLRTLTTFNLEQLARFQPNKNRRYTQLQPGKLNCNYREARVHQVQLLRETLDIGARIEATPAAEFIPFAFLLPQSGDYHFCGYDGISNGFIQAGGGNWDIRFKHKLDYVATVFDRHYFCQGYAQLTGQEIPKQFLQSRLSQTSVSSGELYASSIVAVLQLLSHKPKVLSSEAVSRLLCSELLKLTINTLSPSLSAQVKLSPVSKRVKGVKKALEYIQAFAAELPDINTLCRVASLSERSLQYGFQDHLGMTPVQYLRIVRLNAARRQLQQTSKGQQKVSDVALQWGFLELGRFARDYKQLFLELPSETLAQ